MTDKIQKAAEIIQHEVRKNVGAHIYTEDALRLARELHKLWSERYEVRQLPPGEVAQKMRERYEQTPNYLKPLLEDELKNELPVVSTVSQWGS